jgi:general secretion pathway protein C
MNYLLDKDFHRGVANTVHPIILLMIVLVAAPIFWEVIKLWTEIEYAPPQNLSYSMVNIDTHSMKANPEQKAAKIASMHLFGTNTLNQKIQTKQKSVPKTRLGIKLIGVFENGLMGRAIIEYKNVQKSYGVEDEIGNLEISLKEVNLNNVVILNNGREEVVELENNRLENSVKLNAKRGVLSDFSKITLDKISDRLQSFRKEAIINPKAALRKVSYIPVSIRGEFQGYRIVSGKKNLGFLEQFGFRDGDLITSVNGIELNSPDQGVHVLSELESTSEIAIEFSRKGKPMFLNVSF